MSPRTDENTWSEYIALIRRRWRIAFIVGAVFGLATLYIAYTLPAVYRSSATILIEQQGIPDEFVQTSVNAYAEQLIQTIYQRVVAAPRVEEMIEEFDLFASERGIALEDDLIGKFRENTSVKPQNVTTVHSRTGRETIVTFGFQVSFDYNDPKIARDVTQALADQFVTENALLRGEAAARTTAFLETEAKDIEKQLADIAEEVAAFKEQNANNLPEDQAVNLRTWERLRDELTQVEGRMREVRETRSLLETEIADTPRYRAVMDDSGEAVLGGVERLGEAQQELIRLQGRYNESHPDIIALKREIATLSASPENLAAMVQELRDELVLQSQELASAREAYSESHPDVIRLRNAVGSLQEQLQNLEREMSTSSVAAQPNNPMYLQARTRLRTADAELQDLTRRRGELTGRINSLDRRMATAPQVERDFVALTQERDVLLERYRELKDMESKAALGQALESGQSGERFNILEPARVPGNPISPDRIALTFLGMVLALAAALGTAALTEAMDTKVRGRRDVYQLLEAPPIGIIPYVETKSDRFRRLSTNFVMGTGFAAAIGFVAAAVLSG